MLKRIAIGLGALLLVLVLLASAAGVWLWHQSQSGGDPAFFESDIASFEATDAEEMPRPGGIVFTGSSSIRLWSSLALDMAPLPVINRGFGGAHMEHVVHNMRRIVTPYAPRAVVVFVGGNDIGSGKAPERVVADFGAFLEILHSELPETEVWLLSMKPSKLRWEDWGKALEVDDALRRIADADARVYFVETGRTLLGEDGAPDDVYWLDGLHLNEEGYRRWTATLKPLLLGAYGPNAR